MKTDGRPYLVTLKCSPDDGTTDDEVDLEETFQCELVLPGGEWTTVVVCACRAGGDGTLSRCTWVVRLLFIVQAPFDQFVKVGRGYVRLDQSDGASKRKAYIGANPARVQGVCVHGEGAWCRVKG